MVAEEAVCVVVSLTPPFDAAMEAEEAAAAAAATARVQGQAQRANRDDQARRAARISEGLTRRTRRDDGRDGWGSIIRVRREVCCVDWSGRR